MPSRRIPRPSPERLGWSRKPAKCLICWSGARQVPRYLPPTCPDAVWKVPRCAANRTRTCDPVITNDGPGRGSHSNRSPGPGVGHIPILFPGPLASTFVRWIALRNWTTIYILYLSKSYCDIWRRERNWDPTFSRSRGVPRRFSSGPAAWSLPIPEAPWRANGLLGPQSALSAALDPRRHGPARGTLESTGAWAGQSGMRNNPPRRPGRHLFPLHDLEPVGLKLRHDHLGQVSGLFRLYPMIVRSGIIFLRIFDKRGMDRGVDHVSRIGHRHFLHPHHAGRPGPSGRAASRI
jgi:hypothetical protein